MTLVDVASHSALDVVGSITSLVVVVLALVASSVVAGAKVVIVEVVRVDEGGEGGGVAVEEGGDARGVGERDRRVAEVGGCGKVFVA